MPKDNQTFFKMYPMFLRNPLYLTATELRLMLLLCYHMEFGSNRILFDDVVADMVKTALMIKPQQLKRVLKRLEVKEMISRSGFYITVNYHFAGKGR